MVFVRKEIIEIGGFRVLISWIPTQKNTKICRYLYGERRIKSLEQIYKELA
jgi:hypothetical protein